MAGSRAHLQWLRCRGGWVLSVPPIVARKLHGRGWVRQTIRLSQQSIFFSPAREPPPEPRIETAHEDMDMSDVRGQPEARLGAAAGGHDKVHM